VGVPITSVPSPARSKARSAPDAQGYWLIGQTNTTTGASTVYHYGAVTGFAGNQITTTKLLTGAVGDPNI
jgi:hypothetical protein